MSKLLIVDTETGGLDPQQHSILTLGAVVWEDQKFTNAFSILINEPIMVAGAEALAINKLDINLLKDLGYSPVETVELFTKWLDSNFKPNDWITLAGHNVNFDVGFLKRLYRLAGVAYDKRFDYRVLDTAGIIKFLQLTGKTKCPESFDKALAYFNLGKASHTALGDATDTGKLLNHLIAADKRKRFLGVF